MTNETARHEAHFAMDGVPSEDVRVERVVTSEGLSTPYSVELELTLPAGGLDPHTWVLKPATVAFLEGTGGVVQRRVSGVVTRVRERLSRGDGPLRVEVRLESFLGRLALAADFRLFLDQDVPTIARTLLGESGVPDDAVEVRLTGDHAVHEVRTQLCEVTLEFLHRLLEEEGIFYFFEFREDGACLVLADDPSAYADGEVPTLPYRPGSGLSVGAAIDELTEIEALRPKRVTMRDHDFRSPSLAIEGTASGAAPLDRELYDEPARAADPAGAKRRAEETMHALEAGARRIRGRGDAPSLVAGHVVEIVDAPSDLDGRWAIDRVEVSWERLPGGGVRSESHFEGRRADAPFHPARRAARPVPRGPFLAKVRGPKGEEIHCDEHGRVKVAFVGDRRATHDDRSSAWVRVAQMHTSGSVAIPRVGWEVLVDFEDGDPDRPIILGRLYNGIFLPPTDLPAGKTRSTLQSESTPGGGGKNEIRLEDAGGSEHVAVHAEKDLDLVVANDRTEKITNAASWSVGNNQTIEIGGNETDLVASTKEVVVGGSQTHEVGASRTKTISGAENVTVKGSRTASIGGTHTQLTPMSVSIGSNGSLTETIGGSCVEVAGMSVSSNVAGAATVSVGGALIQAAASGKTETTIGAHATTIGGAAINAAGGDVSVGSGGPRAVTVGGAWAATAGGDLQLVAGGNLTISVGGAVAFNAASIVLEVGGSKVSIAGAAVSLSSSTIKLVASGPHGEIAAATADK